MKRCLAMVTTLAALQVLVLAVPSASALDEADRLFMVGERALEDRFYPVARRALERFVAQYPKDPRSGRALVMLGKARLALNDPQSAMEAFARAQSAVSAPADQLEAKFWQAEALFKLKRFGEAGAAYDAIVRTDAASPRAPEALYGYAWSELELQHPEPAVAALGDFLKTWPEHALAPAATLLLARAHLDLKHVPDALQLLSPFATQYPSSKLIPDAQFLFGWVKVNNGDPHGGLADLRAFVAANPQHEQAPAAQKLIGLALGKSGNRTEMLEAYKTLMEQSPPTAEGLSEAADIARRLARPKDVEAAWLRLKGQFPDHALTRKLALDLAQAAFKQKNWKDASAYGATAAQSEEDAPRAEAWLLVGESELKLKHFPQAAKAFEAVGAISEIEAGTRYRALAGLGLVREEQKEWKAALTAYEAVAGRSPDVSLRDWARDRVAAMKLQLKSGNGGAPPPAKRSDPARPTDKSAGRKS
jgi:TolA-binding protein